MPDKYITLRVSKKRSRRQFAQPLSHPSHALLLLTLACGIGTAQVTTYSAASEVITPGWTPQTYPIPLQPPAIGGAGSYIVDTSIPTYTRIMRYHGGRQPHGEFPRRAGARRSQRVVDGRRTRTIYG